MPPVLKKNGDQLELALAGCRGMEFKDALEKIKEVPGRRFDFENKLWIVPADAQVAERVLKTIRPDCDQELLNWITESKSSFEESLTPVIPDDATEPLLIPWATRRADWQPEYVNEEKVVGLLPFQRAAVQCIADWRRALLCDDMGLGKTFEAISGVEEWCLRNGQPDGPKLIIAPSSVKGSWARELKRWLPPGTPIHVIKGTYTKTKELTADERKTQAIQAGIDENAWIIVNWEQLRIVKEKVKLKNGGTKTVKRMKQPIIAETNWLAVIADEVHRAKNRKAAQTQGLYKVRGQVMIGATGTAMMNSPDELWSPLHWLWPEEYGNSLPPSKANPNGVYRIPYSSFYDEYVDYWEDHWGKKTITGVKNPDALRFALERKLIRRTAALLGLKGRKRFYEPVELNAKQQKLYDEAEKAMWLAVEKDIIAGNKEAVEFAQVAAEGGDVARLIQIKNGASRLVRLQQIIENAALLDGPDDSAVMDYFEEKFADSRPDQWVFFTKYKMSTHLLAERLRGKHKAKVGVYTGDTSPEERTRLEDAFQRGELDAMVGTIGAMKEGITLTSGHLMGFLTRDFVPDINEQCEAREDRLGQQELVRVYIPQAVNTVATDRVEPINRLKEQIVRSVLAKDKIEEERS